MSKTERAFTGRHMLIVMGSAFGVIIAVNLLMAYMALNTFPGTIVKNSYVASQEFQNQIEAVKAREALGWRNEVSHSGDMLILQVRDASGAPVGGLELKGRVERPASGLEDKPVRLVASGPGRYEAPLDLDAGRWKLRIHGRDPAGVLAVAVSEELWIDKK